MQQIEAVKRSKNVVGIGGFYYCDYSTINSMIFDKKNLKTILREIKIKKATGSQLNMN